MRQEPRQPSDFSGYQMQGHDAIKGHEAAMHSYQKTSAFTGNVFQSLGLDAPVVIVQEFEEGSAIELDVLPIHPKLIEFRLWRGEKMAFMVRFHQRRGARFAGNKAQLSFYFPVRNRPRIAQVIEVFSAPHHTLQRAWKRNAPAALQSNSGVKRNHTVGGHIEYAGPVLLDGAANGLCKIGDTEKLQCRIVSGKRKHKFAQQT